MCMICITLDGEESDGMFPDTLRNKKCKTEKFRMPPDTLSHQLIQEQENTGWRGLNATLT